MHILTLEAQRYSIYVVLVFLRPKFQTIFLYGQTFWVTGHFEISAPKHPPSPPNYPEHYKVKGTCTPYIVHVCFTGVQNLSPFRCMTTCFRVHPNKDLFQGLFYHFIILGFRGMPYSWKCFVICQSSHALYQSNYTLMVANKFISYLYMSQSPKFSAHFPLRPTVFEQQSWR